eukprot:jgi/Tetstr1/434184/TSEL_023295.t1
MPKPLALKPRFVLKCFKTTALSGEFTPAPRERLHDNTSPSDAKGTNLVVIDVSDAIHDASGSREVFNEDGTMVRKKCQPGRAARTNPRYPNHDDTMFLDLSSDEDEDVVGSGSEWEYEGSDEEDELELSPTTGRILTAPERLVTHGTVARGAAYCLPCLAEAEALNVTDVNGGQPTGLLYKIPAGTLCRSCKQDAISRFIPQDVEAEKTMVRYKVFKGLAGAKGGISGKYTEWPFTGVGVLEALAYREGMKEYEPSSASSTLRGFVISTCEELERFLGLTDFSSRCFKVFFFAPAGTIRAPVPPLTLSVRSSEYGKGTKLYTMKVVYNVVTLPTVTSGQWDWPQHFPTDIEKWPRRPPLEYAKPRTTIEATLEAGLRRCWKKQYHADLLVSAELALYRRNVAHEESMAEWRNNAGIQISKVKAHIGNTGNEAADKGANGVAIGTFAPTVGDTEGEVDGNRIRVPVHIPDSVLFRSKQPKYSKSDILRAFNLVRRKSMEDSDFAGAEIFQTAKEKFCTNHNMETVHYGILTTYMSLAQALRD